MTPKALSEAIRQSDVDSWDGRRQPLYIWASGFIDLSLKGICTVLGTK